MNYSASKTTTSNLEKAQNNPQNLNGAGTATAPIHNQVNQRIQSATGFLGDNLQQQSKALAHGSRWRLNSEAQQLTGVAFDNQYPLHAKPQSGHPDDFRSPQKVNHMAHATHNWKGSPEDVLMESDSKRTPGSLNKIGNGHATQQQAPRSRSASAASSPIKTLNSTRVCFKPIHEIVGNSNQNNQQQ